MKAIRSLALVAIAASLSAPAIAGRSTITVKTATNDSGTAFGGSDIPRGCRSDSSRIVSLGLCNRNLYACERAPGRAQNAMVDNEGLFEARCADRSGHPKAG